MFIYYLNRVKSKVIFFLKKDYIGRLDSYEKKLRKLFNQVQPKGLRVMIGPSFAIWGASYVMDKSLSFALKLRGVEVIPIYCDSIQSTECNYIGGHWGDFEKDCIKCKRTSEKLWRLTGGALKFSSYLTEEDHQAIIAEISELDLNGLLKYKKDNIAYGKIARDVLINNYLVNNVELIENHHFLLAEHLKNLLLVNLVYGRILDEIKPDRVISNDSFYGMWALLQEQCRRRLIPFYSHWPATRNRVTFGYNDAAMNMNFRKSWENFSRQELTKDDLDRIDGWLSGDRNLIINTTKLAGHEIHSGALSNLNLNKPTLILAANVIWDLAALNKETIFDGMIRWIIETIDWFSVNSNYQLIIKPHPVEASPGIPQTIETVETALRMYGFDRLPDNVHLIRAEESVTISSLANMCSARGFIVYTSTVGFEFVAKGFHVVTAGMAPYRGFGFTIDPKTKEDYFYQLNKILSSDAVRVDDTCQSMAKKFLKFYQFHYYSNFELFDGETTNIKNDYINRLMSEDGAFNYVVNCILDGVEINDENRWIPAS